MPLPTNRSTANTPAEHVADHNTGHGLLNTLEGEPAARAAADALLIPLTQKGAASGVATLDAAGVVPYAQMPNLVLGNTYSVATQAAMLALAATKGDMAIRTDFEPDKFFILTSNSPGTLADWKEVSLPGTVGSVDGQTGAVVLSGTYATTTALAGKVAKTFLGVSDAPYSATGDGVANDTVPFQSVRNAAAAGTIKDIYLAGGKTYLVDETAFYINTSNLRYFSDPNNPATVRFRSGGPAVNAMLQQTAYVENLALENIVFDGNNVASEGIVLAAIRGRVRIAGCKFVRTNKSVQVKSMAEVVIEDCVFDDQGLPTQTAIDLTTGCRDVTIRRNRFLWTQNGILVAGTISTGNGPVVENIRVHDNYFDQGWWLLRHKTTNSGASVTYAATTLTDTAATFTGLDLAANDTVRVMPVRRTGTVTSLPGTHKLIDSAADFVAAGVRRGDIVRTGSLFAVVAGVDGATTLIVEGWWSDTDRSEQPPPAVNAAYTVYGVVLGRITAIAATVLTVQYFHDFDGVASTPAAGTRYEVMVRKGNYPIHTEAACLNSTFTNNVIRRGWSDQLSIFGSHNVIEANTIEDGQDAGITIQSGNHNVVNGNHVKHQGALGIYAGCNDSVFVGNDISDTKWQNYFDNSACDFHLAGARNVVSGNKLRREATALVAPNGLHGLNATENLIIGNHFTGYSTAAMHLAATCSNNRILFNVGTLTDLGTGTTFLNSDVGFIQTTGAQTKTGRLTLGNGTPSADLTRLLVAENVTATANHGIRDESAINASAAGAQYGAIDAAPVASGSSAYDHLAGLQNRSVFSGSGSLTHMWGYLSNPTVNGPGTVTNLAGVHIRNPFGAGPITNNIGIRIEALTRGTNNFAIYTEGTARSQFGGPFEVAFDSASTSLAGDGHFIVAGFGANNGRKMQLGYNTTGNHAWIQALDAGVAYTPLALQHNGGNLGIGTATAFGGGSGVIGIKNATTAPTTNPASGGVLYVEGGALKHRTSAGDIFSSAKQAAQADTTGATLAALETEVNGLKAKLRTAGLMA